MSSEEKVTEGVGPASPELTEEQKAFLEECEKDFSKRYTDEDEEFALVFAQELSSPPILYPWCRFQNNRHSGGNYSRNYDQRNRYHDRGYDNRRQYNPRPYDNDRRSDGMYALAMQMNQDLKIYPGVENVDWWTYPGVENVDWWTYSGVENVDWWTYSGVENVDWWTYSGVENVDWWTNP